MARVEDGCQSDTPSEALDPAWLSVMIERNQSRVWVYIIACISSSTICPAVLKSTG